MIAFPTRLLAGDWPSWTTHLYFLCALLGLGHLHERLSSQGRGAPEGLLGRTFISLVGNR